MVRIDLSKTSGSMRFKKNFKIKVIIAVMIMITLLTGSFVLEESRSEEYIEKNILVKLERVGGITGIHWCLYIYQDGRVLITDPRIEDKLTQYEISDLKDVFEKNNFFTLDDTYKPSSVVVDSMASWITCVNNGKTRTVLITTGSDTPETLTNILLKINEITDNIYRKANKRE